MYGTILSIENIRFFSEGRTIFQDAQFKIERGQHMLIEGPSGSGKTALLKIIAGLLNTPAIFNFPGFTREVEKARHVDPLYTPFRLIAFVPMKHHFRDKSNSRNFYYQQRFNASDSESTQTVGQYLKGISVDIGVNLEERYYESLKIGNLADRSLIQLSNGETRRVLIAAALMRKPQVLVLDNPFAGLDVSMRAVLDKVLQELAAEGTHIVLSSHASEFPSVITHIGAIKDGGVHIVRRDKYVPPVKSNGIKFNRQALNDLLSKEYNHGFRELISMKHVNISYGDKQVLHDVNWRVLPGERWVLSGENGAGKSTLLSLVNGDNPQAYANDIILFDRKRGSGETIWDIKKNIGFLSPELFQYFPSGSSCAKVIESGFYDTLGLFRPSSPRLQSKVKAWLALMGLEKYENTLFSKLSAGSQRLCLVARAMVKNPALLILDEPCQGLDETQRESFLNMLDLLCDLSTVAIVYVSHYQEEVPQCIKHRLKLNEGRVVENY